MSYFIIECSENILQIKAPEEILNTVYETAETSGLFADEDIRVRLNPYSYDRLGKSKSDFVHVFVNIMEGRDVEQKALLLKNVILALSQLLPEVSIVSMNIREFDLNTYSNKALVDPVNTRNGRHFTS
jgi:5-carboxymethyl-2-hydroxymuconate isomerase